MATQIKYYVASKGIFLDSSGADIIDRSENGVSFASEADALSFVEETLPVGEYTLHAFVEKI